MTADLERSAEDVVSELRSLLVRRYGWALLETELEVLPERRTLVCRGRVLTARVRQTLRRRLATIAPDGWQVDLSRVELARSTDTFVIAQPTRVFRGLGDETRDELSTELLPSDGPVAVLARAGDATLVRAIDATIGWIREPLGARTSPARLAAPRAASPALLGAALESWLGAPYSLGGTRASGVDCSGLVQRVLRSALGVTVPRHSTDQRAWTEASCDAQPAHGDLIFVWTDAEAPCHVGITRLEGGSLRVVHASQSRMRVVSDGFDEFAHDARRLERVPIASVVSAYSRFVGAPWIELGSDVG